MERIGLYGGTFGPPHLGHVYAAKTFLREVPLDRLLIMPAGIPPHKEKDAGDTPESRLAMCRAAFGHLPHTEISDYEIRKPGKSYTVETLEHLASPEREITMLCGTDMFLTLDRWHRAPDIFALCAIACLARESGTDTVIRETAERYRELYHAKIVLLTGEPLVLSSSEIREKLRAGADVTPYLPREVAEICRRERLYAKKS